MTDKDLAAGWNVDPFTGSIVHFAHLPVNEGEELWNLADDPHCVVTVNGTLDQTGENMHVNHYFADSLVEAVALAGRLAVGFQVNEVAESVVAIRRATEEEVDIADKLSELYVYHVGRLEALSDKQAGDLVNGRPTRRRKA